MALSTWGLAGGGAAAWPRVASAVTRQPACSVKRLVPLTCGPSGLFEFPMIFNHPNFEIQNSDLPDVQNSPNFAWRYFEAQGTTFLFVLT
jgi:hypothetical protein